MAWRRVSECWFHLGGSLGGGIQKHQGWREAPPQHVKVLGSKAWKPELEPQNPGQGGKAARVRKGVDGWRRLKASWVKVHPVRPGCRVAVRCAHRSFLRQPGISEGDRPSLPLPVPLVASTSLCPGYSQFPPKILSCFYPFEMGSHRS